MFSEYAWVVPCKGKKGITVTNAFKKIISKGCKPNKIWVGKGSEFNLFELLLRTNDIEMYSTNNEGISAVAESFIRSLKNKIYKHMTAISKNVYFGVLGDIVNKYNNTVHRTIKITFEFYAEYNEDSNEKHPKFTVGDRVRISKYKSILEK